MSNKDSINKETLIRNVLPFTLIVTLYGLATLFTKTNPILDAVGLEGRFFFEYDDSFRKFRVTGCNISAEVYGLACGILSLCGIFWIKKKSKIEICAIIFLIINMFLAGSRAAMIVILFSTSFYLITYKGLSKTIKYIIIGFITLMCITPVLPESIKNYTSQITSSIIGIVLPEYETREFAGSSVEGREMQIATAMQYLKEKPFFGHGFGYASNVLLQGEKHEGLLGMESHICFIGVEYGIVYAVVIVLFFINCIRYFFRNRKYAPRYAYMGISFVIMYVIFLIGTWVGEAWYFVMPILGYITKKIYIEKTQILQIQQNEEK